MNFPLARRTLENQLSSSNVKTQGLLANTYRLTSKSILTL